MRILISLRVERSHNLVKIGARSGKIAGAVDFVQANRHSADLKAARGERHCPGSSASKLARQGAFDHWTDQLATIAGRFVLSINDTPAARGVCGRFQLEEVPVTYTIGTASGGQQASGRISRVVSVT